MNEASGKPILTLKHGLQRDAAARPKPIQVLRRKHSRVECTVFVKHAHNPAVDGDGKSTLSQ
jgi:hypothetical protein